MCQISSKGKGWNTVQGISEKITISKIIPIQYLTLAAQIAMIQEIVYSLNSLLQDSMYYEAYYSVLQYYLYCAL